MRRIHSAFSKGLLPILLLATALGIFLPAAVYAGGGRQTTTNTADGIDIWQTEFDVSGMKPGTYNILVNAKDAAGNVGVSGPFNIRIDPKAGLPEATIVYPEQGQVMRGDINIVGVASGRYGLKQIFVKIDDGEYKELEGREYWNLFVPAMDLVEGKHTIYAKALDEKDLYGPETKIEFILDVVPPAFELIGREIGDLISGKVNIKAKVTDLNGIQSLGISTDGQKYTSLKHTAGKKGDDARYFQFTINSKNYEDGPLVYFVRAINKTGYSETRPFLFFVNNDPPKIDILSPAIGEETFGPTQVTGRVISGVGLTDFYYEWQGEKHDIPLRPGDPFWAVSINFSLANNRPVPFKVTAVDKSGNVTVTTQRFQDTRRNRTPTLVIDYPQPGLGAMSLAYDQCVYGHIADGFLPQSIFTDNADFFIENIEAMPSFRIPPYFIPVGRNSAQLYAVSEDGATGMTNSIVTLRVNRGAPPEGWKAVETELTLDEPEYYDDYGDYHIPWREDSVRFAGSLDEFNPGTTLEYRMKWNDSWKPINLNGRGSFSLTVDISELPEGPVPIEIRAVRNGVPDIPAYLPVNKYKTKPVISFLTPAQRFGVIERATTASGIVDYYVPLDQVSFSMDGVNFESMDFTPKYGRAWFHALFDFPAMYNNKQVLTIRAVDRAGNIVQGSPDFVFDNSDAFPKIIHNFPLDDDLVTGDFEISGLAYVNVGIAAVYYRILTPRDPWDTVETTMMFRSDVEYDRIETTQNYLVSCTLDDVRDGRNILEIFAEDIYGVQGEKLSYTFNVSTAAPETSVYEPAMDIWNRGNIQVKGTAFDLNGIKNMFISMDNGVSWQKAGFQSSQTEPSQWSINLNTRAYSDGIHSMLIRSEDNFGIQSFSSGIINIDNTPPDLDVGSPGNGDTIGVLLPITGQVYDNIGLQAISIQLVNIEDPSIQMGYELETQFIIMESMDVSYFPDGDYTLKISALDQSGNETSVIRNITFIKARAASEVAIMNPLPGIEHCGPVVVSGRITGAVIPEQVTLLLDGHNYTNVSVNRYGIFRYEMPDESLPVNMPVVFAAAFQTPAGERIVSYENTVKFDAYGPVLTIDSHIDGDIITKRPYLTGRAFIVAPESDSAGTRAERAANRVNSVELSFDNGRTFTQAKGKGNWKFRLETSELETGTLPIIVKANFADGRSAVRRILLTVDTHAPVVNTIGPTENSSHRDEVAVYGSSHDEFDMDSVEVLLRPGDKAGYSVPGFIQGLYLDGMVLGGYTWMTGLGLTFFDDNVKLQACFAQAPSGRYEGWAVGGKVLANIFTTKLDRWFGPDWEFWTTSITLGAHFSYFLMGEDETPTWMGEFLGQWEIIKADMGFFFPKWKYFKSLSLYAEPGLWFAPSDVNSQQAWRTKFTIGFGGRISLF